MAEYTVQRESYNTAVDDVCRLAVAHWNEVAAFRARLHPLVNRPLYEVLFEAGLAEVVTVREAASGVLFGYAVFLMSPMLHADHTAATCDALFIAPEARSFALARRLLAEAEDVLRVRGVGEVLYHSPEGRPIDALLTRTGHAKIETVYAKLIGD